MAGERCSEKGYYGYVEKDRLGRLRATYCSELAPVSLSFTRRKFKEQISVALMVPFLRRPFSRASSYLLVLGATKESKSKSRKARVIARIYILREVSNGLWQG